MNVVLVWNGPANEEERSVLARREVELLRHLRAENVRVSVVLCGDRGGLARDLRDECAAVHVLRVGLPPAAAALARVLIAAAQLRKVLRRVRPDLIEATEALPAIATGIAARGLGNTRVIYRRQHGGGRLRLRFASRLASRLTDRTIVSCEAARELASRDDACPADRVDVATTGAVEPAQVSPAEAAEARRSLGIPSSGRIVAAVSRLRHEKGIDVLIRAIESIGLDDVHLVIAGTGPELERLRELARGTRATVHFLGHRNDVALWLRVADVIAIPSRRQTVGRLTLEAMAAAKPIVASHVGGIPEAIVHGESGWLVPPENEAALAAALRSVLSDNTLAEQLGRAAHERWRSGYTMERMAASRRAVWERALATERR